jgi:hypothetical protein
MFKYKPKQPDKDIIIPADTDFDRRGKRIKQLTQKHRNTKISLLEPFVIKKFATATTRNGYWSDYWS